MAAALCFAALAVLLRAAVQATSLTHRGAEFGVLFTGAAVAFVLGARYVGELPRRTALPFVVGGSLVLQLVAILGRAPGLSDDMFRYVWDGRVQAAGIDPYRYAPIDSHEFFLRGHWLFEATANAPSWCHVVSTKGGTCTLINRPNVTTIYPPVAEAYFWFIHGVSSVTGTLASTFTMQLGNSILAVLTTCTLWYVLRRCGRDPRSAVWWAWCPLVPLEAGNNAHIDVLAVPLLVLGFGVLSGHVGRRSWSELRRSAWGGAFLGIAACVKLIPAIVSPAALRRRTFQATVAVAAGEGLAFLLPYVPHVIADGGNVLGYLPGYVVENGYESGGVTAFGLIDAARRDLLFGVLPSSVDVWVAGAVMLVAAFLVSQRADPATPWRGSLVMAGIALLVATPAYGWYAMLLVSLVVLDGRREWLMIAFGPYFGHLALSFGFHTQLYVGYLPGLITVVTVALVRRRRASLEPVVVTIDEQPTPELVGSVVR
jgi:hypothetical protein